MERLRVLIASPVEPEHALRVAALDPRIELLHEPGLVAPALFTGDTDGDPGFERDEDQERRFGELLARADVLYGLPGGSAAGLVEALRRGTAITWVQGRTAGVGERLAQASELAPETLGRVTVTSAAGAHAQPLAEFCLLGLLAIVRGLPQLERDRAARVWPYPDRPGRELRGRTLLIVGLGGIGAEVARLAAAFGMRLLGVRRDPSREVEHVDEVHAPERLLELARRADDMVVTLPGTPATRGLVSAEVLDALGRQAAFVNVGRGSVVDEPALIERLREDRLAGAALDVFEHEPLPPDSPLWTLPNVILSPHTAALVPAEPERVLDLFLDNLRRRLAGEELRNRVDPQAFY